MIVGIDPGVTGAIAVLRESAELVAIWDMPVFTLRGNSQTVNGAELGNIFARILQSDSKLTVYLENVHTMPGQGGVSGGNFMLGFGIIIGVLADRKIGFNLVEPQVWKRRANLPKRKKDQDKAAYKDMARALAQRLWPSASLGLKKHQGRADALLIARFGGPDKLL
jgi:crossover junction endodeoxyribonuclease RuvC